MDILFTDALKLRRPIGFHVMVKPIGSGYIQFLPAVEYVEEQKPFNKPTIDPPDKTGQGKITTWSVNPSDFGKFLITVFDEWVKNDVARYYVQIFDATLANYVGENPGICEFSETYGDALVIQRILGRVS